MNESTRINEWFVPNFGPVKFRAFIGLLFLPYTGMCISFTIIGSMLSPTIYWDRVVAIFTIYFLALGISAHAADNLGSKKIKPWGNYFSKLELKIMVIVGLSIAYIIGIYYVITWVNLLLFIGIIEGFFLFAYNFELFRGIFHNNFWFALSWGSLPLLAGYIMQTNTISELPLILALFTFLVSFLEIRYSREYKEIKRKNRDNKKSRKLESRLKLLSASTISICIILVIYRIFFL
ncbi:MAG: hypothetical protein ACM31J_03330 [Nitrososphaerales archaeon]